MPQEFVCFTAAIGRVPPLPAFVAFKLEQPE
jgi:hypothetical protein